MNILNFLGILSEEERIEKYKRMAKEWFEIGWDTSRYGDVEEREEAFNRVIAVVVAAIRYEREKKG